MYERSPRDETEKQGNGYIAKMCGPYRSKAYEIVNLRRGRRANELSFW
jgi:hypothetical protein